MMDEAAAGGMAILGLGAIALWVGVGVFALATRPAPVAEAPSDEPWEQRWPRYRKDIRTGARVVVS